MTLGEKITLYCAARDWKLADLAREARLDVRTVYAMTKRGTRTSRFAKNIADAFGIGLEELLDEHSAPAQVSKHLHSREPGVAYESGAVRLSGIETQLITLFRGCKSNRQDDLLAQANLWFVENNPGPSVANPFPSIRKAPAPPRIKRTRKP